MQDGEELEEGEVSDEDEKRPEETEPKPVCRFYTRGQCTWGMSCRFLHPGVTDKGNYTMFDMIRPVPVNAHGPPYGPGGIVPSYHHGDFRGERPPPMHPMHNNAPPPQARPMPEPVVESAWERGLRTAKEMMRKANKRKEQDMDFEDKKMNLSASQDELERDNYYIRERSPPELSPPPPMPPAYGGGGRGPMPMHHPGGPKRAYSPPHPHPHQHQHPRNMPPRPGPGPVPFDDDPYGRSLKYRELPPHRMPQYEDEIIKRRIRPAREVIVQRAEPAGRGDEWMDPWMRSKSPGREREKRQKRERRSYSSNSSYSSSRYEFFNTNGFCKCIDGLTEKNFFSPSFSCISIVIVRHSLDQVQTQVDRLHRHDADDTVVHVTVTSHRQFVVDMLSDHQHQKCIKGAILQVSNRVRLTTYVTNHLNPFSK